MIPADLKALREIHKEPGTVRLDNRRLAVNHCRGAFDGSTMNRTQRLVAQTHAQRRIGRLSEHRHRYARFLWRSRPRRDDDAVGIKFTNPSDGDGVVASHPDGVADGHAGVSATAAGSATLQEAGLSQTADSILMTLVLALGAVGVLLTLVYRLVAGSASLGAVTAVPVTLVTALVVGGMWLFEVPLTLLTALLLSLVIGVGIDYNIHVSDRFVHERERGRSVHDALVEATTGTGGALLGSTLTSAGAFSALLLHPHPQFQSFGTLVVLAMVTSFVVAVFVLPSMLALWARYGPASVDADAAADGVAIADD